VLALVRLNSLLMDDVLATLALTDSVLSLKKTARDLSNSLLLAVALLILLPSILTLVYHGTRMPHADLVTVSALNSASRTAWFVSASA
jgi:hypothetical protein